MQGLLLLNKPCGITSFKAVAEIRRKSGERRIGHTGTLDPMATGVLPILIGRATALSSYLLDADKEYRATILLGTVTDTCDVTGNVISKNVVSVSKETFKEALEKFTGKIEQTPPMYSAIRQNGVRLYELARKGIEAEIPKRSITVYSASLVEIKSDCEYVVDFSVSKGTYIRSLARDIGEYLGCGATLSSLCRTSASGFDLDDCTLLDNITPDNITSHLLSEEVAVRHFREISVTEKQAIRFSNGGALAYDRLKKADFSDGELLRVKFGSLFLGLGFADNENKQVNIKCVINQYNQER